MRRELATVAIAAVVLSSPAVAPAQLAGRVLRAQFVYPTSTDIVDLFGTAVVGPGVEFSPFGNMSMDFTNRSLRVSTLHPFDVTFLPAAHNGVRFLDEEGRIPDITGVTLGAANTFPFDPARIAFDANSFTINLQSYVFHVGEVLVLDLTFAPFTTPEPATVALLATGLLGVAAVARRGARGR